MTEACSSITFDRLPTAAEAAAGEARCSKAAAVLSSRSTALE